MSYTTNYGFEKIDFNLRPWDTKEYANWDLLDKVLSTIALIPGNKGSWTNSTAYTVGNTVFDPQQLTFWQCAVAHTSAASGTFNADRIINPTYWTYVAQTAGAVRYDIPQTLTPTEKQRLRISIGARDAGVRIITTTTAILANDVGKLIRLQGNISVPLPSAATVGAGFAFDTVNDSAGVVTLTPSGAETINGRTSLVLTNGQTASFVSDGVNWLVTGINTSYSIAFAPNLRAGSGVITTLSGITALYQKISAKLCFVSIDFTVVANGTGTSFIIATLPFVAQHTGDMVGRERAINGKAVLGSVDTGTADMVIVHNDLVYPGVNGARLTVSGVYEVQ